MATRLLLAGAPTGCWTNLGDEAIFAGMASALKRAVPEVELTVVSSCPEGFFQAYESQEIPFREISALAEAVAESDLVVLGGGSIFFDYWGADPEKVLTPQHSGLELWAGMARLATKHRTPLMVYGAGVGPLATSDGKRLANEVFHTAMEICVRDPGSLEALVALNFSADRARITADPAPGLQLHQAPDLDLPRPWLGVAVREWDLGVEQETWQAATAAALEIFLDRHGGTALFVPCHRAVAWPLTDDSAAARAIQEQMSQQDRTHMVDVESPWRERAALFASCDSVLAMRYHASLLGMAAGVPSVGMSYDPKVSGLYADWEASELVVDLSDAGTQALTRRLERAAAEHDERAMRLGERAAQMRQREAGNVESAKKLLASASHLKRPPSSVRPEEPCVSEASRRASVGAEAGPSRRPAARTSSGPTGRRAPRLGQGHRAAQPRGRAASEERRDRRVAILTNRLLHRDTGEPHIGGGERYARELGNLLRDLGLEPTFFQREGVWGEGEFQGFPVVALPRGEPFSEFEPGVAAAFYERTGDFDHVIVLMPNYASGPLRQDAVVVCHGVWWDHDCYSHLPIRSPEWYEHLERVFTRPRRVVSVDSNSINVVRALFPQAAARMTCIPSFVDLNRFRPPSERNPADPLVLFPRRADVVRGVGLMEPILKRLPEACRVLWVGDGPEPTIQALRSLGDSDPRLTQRAATLDEMPELYREAEIAVIPSVGSEGQSLACLEAMASGCAVVATRVGGLPELIRDGVDGLLCDPTPEAIAGAIRRLLADPALRQELGEAARSAAESQSLESWRARWGELLDGLGWTGHDSAGGHRAAQPGTDRRRRLVGRAGRFRRNEAGREPHAPDPSYDIVSFSILDWEHRWNRPQGMMSAWARRGRRVFYLRVTDHLPPGGEPFTAEQLDRNLWQIRLALPEPLELHSGVHPEGFTATAMEGLRALRQRFGIERAVAFVEAAGWTPLGVRVREEFSWPLIYDCMDDWQHFPGIGSQSRLLALEEVLVVNADAVVVSSATLAKRWGDRRTDLVLARNAVDFDFFQESAVEDPLPGIEGPIAGFIGAIAEWFDTDLLVQVARTRPEITFVLVGGVHRVQIPELERLPNLRLEGERPYGSMPDYLHRFDVCLVPFQVSPTTDAMDVLKLYQYLSLGKPVVSTPIREMAHYSEVVYLAADAEEFANQLDRALSEADPELVRRRIAVARANTWDERLDRIEEAIVPYLDGHGRTIDDPAERLKSQRSRIGELEAELGRWQQSRAWRVADLYWRGRRFLSRALRPFTGS